MAIQWLYIPLVVEHANWESDDLNLDFLLRNSARNYDALENNLDIKHFSLKHLLN